MPSRLITGLALTLVLAAPALAQVPADSVPADSVPADTIPRENRGPRNAFIKSMLIPGWGHFAIGSEKRGAFYVALQGSSWYMLVKTLGKLADAKDSEAARVGVAVDSLEALMAEDTAAARRLSDPIAFEAALGADPDVLHGRGLVNSRKQQRQDWITYTLFFTFLSAVDSYVNAHLKTFPADISVSPAADGGGGLSLRVDLPLPVRGRR